MSPPLFFITRFLRPDCWQRVEKHNDHADSYHVDRDKIFNLIATMFNQIIYLLRAFMNHCRNKHKRRYKQKESSQAGSIHCRAETHKNPGSKTDRQKQNRYTILYFAQQCIQRTTYLAKETIWIFFYWIASYQLLALTILLFPSGWGYSNPITVQKSPSS